MTDESRNARGGPTQVHERNPGHDGHVPTILIVDDSYLVLEVLRDFFVAQGYLVDQAESAEIALALLENALPDVIVSDILMPGMDGWGLFENVRDREETAEIPFVFLTSETELPKRLRAIELGAEDYMTKPFDVEELHARIERILARQGRARAAPARDDALLSGTVEHLAMPDLLQVLSLNDADGEVLLRQEANEGWVVLSEGNVVHAECGAVIGIKALYRMLDWSRARFRLIPPRSPAASRTIHVSTANLVMDGLVSLDEWRRWAAELPSFDVIVAQTAQARSALDNLEAPEIEVVNAAADGTTLREILDTNPRPDSEIASALVKCLGRGELRTLD